MTAAPFIKEAAESRRQALLAEAARMGPMADVAARHRRRLREIGEAVAECDLLLLLIDEGEMIDA